jgi:hypothetical protein
MMEDGSVARRTRVSLIVLSCLAWPMMLVGQTINSLTAQEKARGWELLFDGKTLKGWHPSAPSRVEAEARPRSHRSPERSLRSGRRRSRVSRRQRNPLRRRVVRIGKSWMGC